MTAGRSAGMAGAGGSAERQDALTEMYGEMILDHNRRPRNFGRLDAASHSAQGNNPLCGDRVAVYLLLDGDRIQDIAFDGAGCAISTASASMMTEALRGKPVGEARQLFERFRALLTQDPAATDPDLGSLMAFAGVRQYPMRVKCATLPWHALVAALGAPAAGGAGAGAVADQGESGRD
jgi:nitrogen fixation protein NifU and related proteins